MQAIQGIYDGKSILPLEPVRAHPNVRVIITFIDDETTAKTPSSKLEDVAGCLRHTGPAKTISEMHAAIQKGIGEHWR